eukprot:TRINITY_DN11480_c0_g1_i1.p1 TRINITY_DN11480_c0_g1~~TRINITY_DN11480_c0_g1_i1.p1  ORF type:complete len:311 (-),score=37.63 TRINITY_DN11480_c0_g1_i1:105-1037(-)
MMLNRRKTTIKGVYQASTFKFKPPNSPGLKTGGYFVTLDACQEIVNILSATNPKRLGKGKKRRQLTDVVTAPRFDSVVVHSSSTQSHRSSPIISTRPAMDDDRTTMIATPAYTTTGTSTISPEPAAYTRYSLQSSYPQPTLMLQSPPPHLAGQDYNQHQMASISSSSSASSAVVFQQQSLMDSKVPIFSAQYHHSEQSPSAAVFYSPTPPIHVHWPPPPPPAQPQQPIYVPTHHQTSAYHLPPPPVAPVQSMQFYMSPQATAQSQPAFPAHHHQMTSTTEGSYQVSQVLNNAQQQYSFYRYMHGNQFPPQ